MTEYDIYDFFEERGYQLNTHFIFSADKVAAVMIVHDDPIEDKDWEAFIEIAPVGTMYFRCYEP